MGINFFPGKKYWSQTTFHCLNKDRHWIPFHLFQNEGRERKGEKKRFKRFKNCWNSLYPNPSLLLFLPLFLSPKTLSFWMNESNFNGVESNEPRIIRAEIFVAPYFLSPVFFWRENEEREERKIPLIHVWKKYSSGIFV